MSGDLRSLVPPVLDLICSEVNQLYLPPVGNIIDIKAIEARWLCQD